MLKDSVKMTWRNYGDRLLAENVPDWLSYSASKLISNLSVKQTKTASSVCQTGNWICLKKRFHEFWTDSKIKTRFVSIMYVFCAAGGHFVGFDVKGGWNYSTIFNNFWLFVGCNRLQSCNRFEKLSAIL